jgi:hypothetical protein
MLITLILVFSAILSLLTGGRLKYSQTWGLKKLWLALLASGIQVLLFTAFGTELFGETLVPIVYLITLALLIYFLFINRKVFGIPLLLVGLLLNFLVIGANGGRMPASSKTLIAAGRPAVARLLETKTVAGNCVLMSSTTKLNFLGDIIVIRLGGAIGSAYSVGDLVTLAGEALIIFGIFRKKPEAPTSPLE